VTAGGDRAFSWFYYILAFRRADNDPPPPPEGDIPPPPILGILNPAIPRLVPGIASGDFGSSLASTVGKSSSLSRASNPKRSFCAKLFSESSSHPPQLLNAWEWSESESESSYFGISNPPFIWDYSFGFGSSLPSSKIWDSISTIFLSAMNII
jgi:hypothetical protein